MQSVKPHHSQQAWKSQILVVDMIFAPVFNVRVIMEAFIGSPSPPIVLGHSGSCDNTELSPLYCSTLNRVAIIIICWLPGLCAHSALTPHKFHRLIPASVSHMLWLQWSTRGWWPLSSLVPGYDGAAGVRRRGQCPPITWSHYITTLTTNQRPVLRTLANQRAHYDNHLLSSNTLYTSHRVLMWNGPNWTAIRSQLWL